MRKLLWLIAMISTLAATRPSPEFDEIRPGISLQFPRDHGAHPGFRTEWWYLTGWLDGPGDLHRGFQITFFRTATGIGANSKSAFAPRQILFAHAAISDPRFGYLLHGERIEREGFGLATASPLDTDVTIDDWRLRRNRDGRFVAHVSDGRFILDLIALPTQPVLLEGEHGYSRKGPGPNSASRYFSLPHLAVSGRLTVEGVPQSVSGTAWLDREWSSSYLPQRAVGWDWTGLNFDDGSALMAFRMRAVDGTTVWAGGSWRAADGVVSAFGPGDVGFEPRHRWRSPRTGALYPVDPVIRIRSGGRTHDLPLRPLFFDQELDGRAAGNPVYWEGAVTTSGGRGYLELTGYAGSLHI